MTIGQLLQERRRTLGFSLDDVGKAVGVNRTTIMRWEKDSMKIDCKHIGALSRTLGIDPIIFCHPNEVYFADERQLVEAWRKADNLTKAMVRKILGIEEKKGTPPSEKYPISYKEGTI